MLILATVLLVAAAPAAPLWTHGSDAGGCWVQAFSPGALIGLHGNRALDVVLIKIDANGHRHRVDFHVNSDRAEPFLDLLSAGKTLTVTEMGWTADLAGAAPAVRAFEACRQATST
jgi:hypothetical protein